MEKRPRSLFAGGTDYTGVGSDVIVAHLEDWLTSTRDTIETLKQQLDEVEACPDLFESPREVQGYIERFVDLFERYRADFDRLIRELPVGVARRHLETLNQIYESSRNNEAWCIRFSDKQINKALRDEEAHPILDRIYAETRGQIIDYQDLANVRYRLGALIGGTVDVNRKPIDDIDALELKPNFFGLGINLNHIIKRVAGSVGRKRAAKASKDQSNE